MKKEYDLLIQKYFDHLLSDQEAELFEKLLEENEEFRNQFFLELSISNSLDENAWSYIKNRNHKFVLEYQSLFQKKQNIELRKTLRKVQKEYNQKTKPKTKRFAYYSVAIIALIISTFFLFPNKPSNEELYSQYLNNTELLSLVNRDDLNGILSKSQTAFDNQNYDSVIQYLSPEIQKLNSSNAYIYLAISQMEENLESEAKTTLNQLISSDLLDAQKGYWYKSLLFLKFGRKEDLKNELQVIIKNNYFKKKEAKELLEKLH